MSIEVHALQRLSVTEESLANFATDLTASATYLDVPIQEGTAQVELLTEQLEPMTVQQRIDAYPLSVLGHTRARLTFTMPLHGLASAAGDGADSPAVTDNALLTILKAVFGGGDAENTGSDVDSASAADTLTPTSNADFQGGASIGWVDSSSVYHLHEVARQPGSNVETKMAFPDTPSSSDVLYAGTTIYLADNPTTSLQFIVEGAEQSDRWLLLGGQATSPPTITREIGQIPTIAFTLEFAAWAREPETAITAASYADYDPQYVQGFFRAQVGGTTTRNVLDAARVEYQLAGPMYVPVPSQSGTNGIARWRRMRAAPLCTLTFSVPYEAYATWFQERDDKDYYAFEDQIGVVAGSTIVLSVPKAQIWDAQRVDEGGLAYQQVIARSTIDSYASGGPDELIRSAFRMHFG